MAPLSYLTVVVNYNVERSGCCVSLSQSPAITSGYGPRTADFPRTGVGLIPVQVEAILAAIARVAPSRKPCILAAVSTFFGAPSMNDNVIVQFPAEMRRLDDVLRQVRLRVGREIGASTPACFGEYDRSIGHVRDLINAALWDAMPNRDDDDMVPFAPVAA